VLLATSSQSSWKPALDDTHCATRNTDRCWKLSSQYARGPFLCLTTTRIPSVSTECYLVKHVVGWCAQQLATESFTRSSNIWATLPIAIPAICDAAASAIPLILDNITRSEWGRSHLRLRHCRAASVCWKRRHPKRKSSTRLLLTFPGSRARSQSARGRWPQEKRSVGTFVSGIRPKPVGSCR